ncbi:DUF1616 domain-containing protein [Haloprofundus salilacus]|uniref:DUF1616 domain-containing protein n=1 Tax=Haloprofundus salilacus TaxID=2876190 RepID=UPI001CCF0078|nr:DUF1616 domain-containing protein [Haloprofundus salilacus]
MSVRDSLFTQFLDIAVCVAFLVVYAVLALLFGIPSPGIAFLGGLYVAFVPGYAIVSALFPRSDAVAEATGDSRRLTLTHRVVLSVGMSLVVVALVGLVLTASPLGLFARPSLVAVGGVSAVGLLVATIRRFSTPPDRRFSVTVPRGTGFFSASSGAEAVVTLLIVLCVLVAFGGIGYAVVTPEQGETFSGLSVLTQNDSGQLTASDYPTEFVRGETQQVFVQIANEENQQTEYTVVVSLQEVDADSGAVTESSELARFEESVPSGETVVQPVQLEPQRVGEQLRVQFLLYKGSPPADPSAQNAYRNVHFWTTVRENGDAATNRSLDGAPPAPVRGGSA